MTLEYKSEEDKYEYIETSPRRGESQLALLILALYYPCFLGTVAFLIFFNSPFLATIGLKPDAHTKWLSIVITVVAAGIAYFIQIVLTGNVKYAIFKRIKREAEHPVVGSSQRAMTYYGRRFGNIIHSVASTFSWIIVYLLYMFTKSSAPGLTFLYSPWMFILLSYLVAVLLTVVFSFVAFKK